MDYSDAYILVTGDIKVVGGGDLTNVAFKNCHLFTSAVIKLNDQQVDSAFDLDLTMNLYNLIEYSDNYADTAASLYHYKRPEQSRDNNIAIDDLSIDNSSSFKYQWGLIKKEVNPTPVGQNIDPHVANAHTVWENVKIAVSLKYISNFFRALEIPHTNTKQ